ncbi:hypothetical protein DF044_38485, partial [Burkholderia contaminans]|uniref:hypothetical protein n=1 Tax=Burkholderia contaminans TaxID=488447 RepID=UPI000F9408E3
SRRAHPIASRISAVNNLHYGAARALTLVAAQSNLEQSKATADTNLVTLCKALGGGWESTYSIRDADR